MFNFKIKFTVMNKKNLVIITCFLLIKGNLAFSSNDSLTIKNLEYRIKKIEDYRTLDDRRFDNKAKEIELKIEDYRIQKTVLDWIALAIGGFALVSLFGFWLKAKKLAEKKIEEKFETIFNEKKHLLLRIIDSHDKETELKKKSSILILESKQSNTDFLENFFSKLGFNNTLLKKVSDYEPIDEKINYDLLFLFREDSNYPLEDTLCKKYIDASRSDSIVFIFGGKQLDITNIKSRSSSATFWSQIYGNLISALKYQEIID